MPQTDTVTIPIEAIDNASDKARNVSFSFTELASAINLGRQVIQSFGEIASATFGEFQKYAGEVRDLALISGTGAEETSKFIQVLDDYQLTAQDAEAATRALKEKGLVPSINTLATLADEYKKIKDPAEKMQFIQDNLGRGGVKWVNVLNQQSSALRAQAEQVDKNLILSDEQIEKAERERLAIDKLSDAYEGIKISIGAWFGELVLTTDEHQRAIEIMKAHGEQVYRGVEGSQAYKDALQEVRDSEKAAADATRDATAAGDAQTLSLKQQEEAAKAVSDANNQFLSVLGNMQNAEDSYAEKKRALATERAGIAAGDLEAIQRNNDAVAENERKHEEATRSIVLGLLEQKLAEGGLTDDELNFLLQKGQAWGVWSETVVNETRKAVSEANALTAQLQSRTVTITTNYVNNYSSVQQTAPNYYASEHRAGGGPMNAGQSYVVGEVGPEIVTPRQAGMVTANKDIIDYDRVGDAVARAFQRLGIV